MSDASDFDLLFNPNGWNPPQVPAVAPKASDNLQGQGNVIPQTTPSPASTPVPGTLQGQGNVVPQAIPTPAPTPVPAPAPVPPASDNLQGQGNVVPSTQPQSIADINRAKGEPAGGKLGVTKGAYPQGYSPKPLTPQDKQVLNAVKANIASTGTTAPILTQPQSIADINRAKGEPAGGKLGVTKGAYPQGYSPKVVSPAAQKIAQGTDAQKDAAKTPVAPAAQKIAQGTDAQKAGVYDSMAVGGQDYRQDTNSSTFMNKQRPDISQGKGFFSNLFDILQGKNTVLGAIRGQPANEAYKGPGPLSKAFQDAGAALAHTEPSYLKEMDIGMREKELQNTRAMKELEIKANQDLENLRSSNEYKNATAEEQKKMEDAIVLQKQISADEMVKTKYSEDQANYRATLNPDIGKP